MSDDLEDRGAQDRNRISLEQDWEVRHWTEKFGVSVDELKEAVKKVGPMAKDVAQYFSRAKA